MYMYVYMINGIHVHVHDIMEDMYMYMIIGIHVHDIGIHVYVHD